MSFLNRKIFVMRNQSSNFILIESNASTKTGVDISIASQGGVPFICIAASSTNIEAALAALQSVPINAEVKTILQLNANMVSLPSVPIATDVMLKSIVNTLVNILPSVPISAHANAKSAAEALINVCPSAVIALEDINIQSNVIDEIITLQSQEIVSKVKSGTNMTVELTAIKDIIELSCMLKTIVNTKADLSVAEFTELITNGVTQSLISAEIVNAELALVIVKAFSESQITAELIEVDSDSVNTGVASTTIQSGTLVSPLVENIETKSESKSKISAGLDFARRTKLKDFDGFKLKDFETKKIKELEYIFEGGFINVI